MAGTSASVISYIKENADVDRESKGGSVREEGSAAEVN